ncbi:hypothetical protein OKE68_08090 [Riemerella anatipestifer]|uniref:Uncharacterized protein n=1 Tax=Riemerella anatipestifer TaxID=34085 RepID=A0AAP3AM60_RIEAN|nr:hypothetical protein [Riemerella anatipestifer]MBT0573643.1 hypothetical protein [Riemerella anatipestifer]MCU7567464.1 hypothetical protein [Riemerella anatipestifer]MCW0490741.1 hypothetical protein [Riemerella anatipestifer]MCW0524270.1 hypothetical protein [Riemerella anatipestifer]MDD1539280.1 hypothetical protein [Riemerella anatipestifer]
MSKEIIQNDIEAIRNETEMYGNTRERVASILTKLNQEKLDAESIPTNIATIDENGKVGTAYTKEQIDTKLEIAESYLHGRLEEHYDFIEDKLPKSESNISTPTVEFKYIYLTNEANETRRMLAGNLGKNLANSKPNNTPNSGINLVTPWYIDTNGIPLFIRQLPNKYADTTFNKKVVIDSNGQVAISEREDITINIPETFNGSASLGSITIGVNHIYPQAIPSRPSFADEIQEIMANYKNINFIPITRADLTLWTKGNKGLPVNRIDSDGLFSLDGNSTDFSEYANDELVVSLTANNIVLPADGNWIFKFNGVLETGYRGGLNYIGVSRHGDDSVLFGVEGSNYSSLTVIGNSESSTAPRKPFICIIVKTGNIICTSIYSGGKCVYHVSNAYTEIGNYTPKINIHKSHGRVNGRMSYKILD